MTSSERALRALRCELQFEMVQCVARVAHLRELASSAQQHVEVLSRQHELAAAQMDQAMNRATFNPAQVELLRRIVGFESRSLEKWKRRCSETRRLEEQARAALAQLRQRDEAFERALQRGEQQRKADRLHAEMKNSDDLWLQHSFGVSA